MKPRTIELKQAPVVLVELPEGNFNIRIEGLIGLYARNWLVYDLPEANNFTLPLPVRENFEIVGILSDLTEEQFAEIVPVAKTVQLGELYYNFKTNKWDAFCSDESFQTLLESEKVYTENPVGELPPDIRDFIDCGDPSDYSRAYNKAVSDWQEAQQRTIDPTRTVVLLRKEDVK